LIWRAEKVSPLPEGGGKSVDPPRGGAKTVCWVVFPVHHPLPVNNESSLSVC